MNDTDRPQQNQNQQQPKAKTTFVSRAGAKLAEAVEKFNPSIDGALCADLGCNVGGFTQCLLRHSAAKVYAIDTGYGVLDWQLRKNPQVVVMERTNALYLKALPELCDLVTIDVSWTRQQLILPAAMRFLKPRGRIISLVKPHYQAQANQLKAGLLAPDIAQQIFHQVCSQLPGWGFELLDSLLCSIAGRAGNREYFVYLAPLPVEKST